MAEISKINAVAIGDVAKVDAVLKADIANINGLTIPSAFTGLLDTYTGATAAYSTRRLYGQYTGACMRVRRDSDNTEQDIGFDGSGDLDTSALATFVGSGNNGFVRYWYDQSQSGGTAVGNDFGQSTSTQQPQIYNGTAVFDEGTNNKPAIQFDRNNNHQMFMGSEESIEFFTHSMVYNQAAADRFNFMITSGINNYYRLETNGLMFLIKANDFDFASGAIGTPGYALRVLIRDTSSTATAYVDASSSNAWTTLDASNMRFRNIDANYSGSGTGFTVTHQEFILWSDAKNATDRAGIESSTNTHFGIY